MHRRHSVFALAALALALAQPAAGKAVINVPQLFQARPKPAQPSLVFTYHGWRIDASRAAHVQTPTRVVRAVRAQIDIVERLGLRPDVLAFMRSQPVICDADPDPAAEAGDSLPGRGVVLHARRLDAKKPILLYALLKAYLAQRLPSGAANPEVTALRAQAAGLRAWPNTARMLQANDEYFALTGAAYLFGAITREPYTRADLKKTQPQAVAWLARLFDGGRPRI